MIWKTVTHTLAYPVMIGDKRTSAVTLREPDVDALEAIEELGIEEGGQPKISQLRGMIAAMSDVSNEVIGKMHRDDLTGLGELLVPLLGEEETAA